MLENCLSGSEGGGANALPTPIITLRSDAFPGTSCQAPYLFSDDFN